MGVELMQLWGFLVIGAEKSGTTPLYFNRIFLIKRDKCVYDIENQCSVVRGEAVTRENYMDAKVVKPRRSDPGFPGLVGIFDMCQERIWEKLKPEH